MFGSMRICGERIAYFVWNGCSPGPKISRSVSAPSDNGSRAGGVCGGVGNVSVRLRLSNHDTPLIGLPHINCSWRYEMSYARRYCASHAGVRCSVTTRPELGVNPASDMFDVTFGGTAAA